jgi:hypothetical protein
LLLGQRRRAPTLPNRENPVPFAQASLTPLIQTNAFNFWHYRTTDSRATVATSGYFAPAAALLRAGDLVLLQASDALALLPIRSNAALGIGVTLDGGIGPLKFTRTAAARFAFRQTARAVVRSLVLAPLAAGLSVGTSLPVSARVVGPMSQVVFSLRDATGAVIPPMRVVAVNGGMASAALPAPPVGGGYRIRVEDLADPNLCSISPSFSVSSDFRLLLSESATALMTEAGSALRL